MKKTKILLFVCMALSALVMVNAQNISWGHLQWQADGPSAWGDFEAMGLVLADGITNAATKDHNAILAQIGYGPTANPNDPEWTWKDAVFNSEWGDNFAFQDRIAAPDANGTFWWSYRFRLNEDGTDWKYAGNEGLWNASDHPCKTFEISDGYAITWTYLQWEASLSVDAGSDFEAMGLVFVNGLTNAATKDHNAIIAQIGYGISNNPGDGTWTWTDAAFNSEWGDNYAFQQRIATPLIEGTYNYSYRFKINTPGAFWVYADTKPFFVINGYQITWVHLQWEAANTIVVGENFEAQGQVYCNGISTADTPDASLIIAQIGYGVVADPTDGSWTWADAAYSSKSGSNMAYQQSIQGLASAGTYYYSYRFKLNTYAANWVYAGNGGVWDASEHPCKSFSVIDSYHRNITSGSIGTVCVPYEISAYSGITLYEIAYIEKDGSDQPVQIYLDEVSETNMAAGKPYIFEATANEMVLTYTPGVSVNSPVTGTNGLVGTFSEIAAAVDNVLVDNYIISANQFWICGVNCSLPANRAYINASMVPTTPSAPAPGRQRIALANGNKVPTAIDTQFVNKKTTIRKFIYDGQLMLEVDGVRYNANGQQIK